MSKKNWVILVILVALIIVLLLLKGNKVDENVLPENNTLVENQIVEPEDIKNELDAVNTEANIEEAMKLIDEELGNL